MHKKRLRGSAAAIGAIALCAAGATALLPARVDQVARAVEKVRGRKFERSVPASEIDMTELKKVLRAKLVEGFPAPPEDTMRTLVALGFFEESPNLVDRMLDFYASQVVAFYDPEPRRFFLVKGAASALPSGGAAEEAGLGSDFAERMIFAHELTHALQDESLKLDRRTKELKDNGDRALALQSLLEGEATLVMIRVVLEELPGGTGTDLEDSIAPLLSAGALDRSSVPKDLPDYFVDQLFFPYADGTAYVRRLVKEKGWAAIDRLWKNPPQSSSEIMHEGLTFTPAADLLPSNPDRLGPPGYKAIYSDTIGEWGVRFLLRRAMEQGKADSLAAGWRGDRIAFYGSGRNVAYLWKIRFDTPLAADRFSTTWSQVRKKNETVATSGRDVTITSGYPGKTAGVRETGNGKR